MQKRNRQLTIGLAAMTGLAVATTNLWADEYGKDSKVKQDQTRTGQYQHEQKDKDMTYRAGQFGAQRFCKASDLIGKDVKNHQNEDLGEVDDVVISLGEGTASFAIIGFGGALGIGETHVAVPLADLQVGPEGHVVMTATKQQIESASKTATGSWMGLANEKWANDIDAWYGQPQLFTRYERQRMQGTEGREFVRTPVEGERQMSPGDNALKQRVDDLLNREATTAGKSQNIQVSVQNGVVTLKGEVDSASQKQTIASNVKEIAGVNRVDNQLKVKNEREGQRQGQQFEQRERQPIDRQLDRLNQDDNQRLNRDNERR